MQFMNVTLTRIELVILLGTLFLYLEMENLKQKFNL